MTCVLLHAKTDSEYAGVLQSCISLEGLRTFINDGKADEEVQSEIKHCSAFVPIITPDFMECPLCADMVMLAQKSHKETFPVHLKPTKLNLIPERYWAGLKQYNVDDCGFEETLIYDLKFSLGLSVDSEPPLLISRNFKKEEQEEEEEEDVKHNNKTIIENQDRFVQMLNEPLTEGGSALGAEGQSPPAAGAPAGPGQNPESGYIQMTLEEKQAVERLKAIGFPESACISAYFACKQDEDLAINLLLSQDFDDDTSQS